MRGLYGPYAVAESLIKRASASARMRSADVLDTVLRRSDRFTPPRRMRGMGGEGDYLEVGHEFLSHLVSLGRLAPHERVVDIGCGPGRLARELESFLGPAASYTGIDPSAACLDWLSEAYKYRRDFEFVHVDLQNGLYNPDGAIDPATWRFPFDDATHDAVTMFSLMTHVLPDTVERYLHEARRVLIPGGWILATMFLLDDAARAAIDDGSAIMPFQPDDGRVAYVDPELPEQAIAYDQEWVLDRISEAGFATVGIRHGTWVPRGTGRTLQDIVVARVAAPDGKPW